MLMISTDLSQAMKALPVGDRFYVVKWMCTFSKGTQWKTQKEAGGTVGQGEWAASFGMCLDLEA